MKAVVYSVRDNVSGKFGTPMFGVSDELFIRDFSYNLNRSDTVMNKFPKDFDIYKIAVWDEDTAIFTTCDPLLIARVSHLLDME